MASDSLRAVEEIPSHDHQENAITSDGNLNPIVNNQKAGSASGAVQPTLYGWNNGTAVQVRTGGNGGNNAHNIIQPSVAVYGWRRTA